MINQSTLAIVIVVAFVIGAVLIFRTVQDMRSVHKSVKREPLPDHEIVTMYAECPRSDAQAEPKREPTCLWSRADDDTDVWETSCGHAFTIVDGTPGDNHMEFCCYCGRPLEQEIGGSDAE